MAKKAIPRPKDRIRSQPALGVPGVKKLKKKSLVVIVAPAGTNFPTGANGTKVSSIKRLATATTPELIFTKSIPPKVTAQHILLSIKGPNTRAAKAKGKKLFDDTPDPGSLTITLTDQGPNIDPIVVVPVVFVDDFDPGT